MTASQSTDPSPQQLYGADAIEKLRGLLAPFRTAMFVTSAGDQLHGRPMGLTQSAKEFDGCLWFFTDDQSFKIEEIEGGAATTLIFQSDDKHAYLQLDGRARTVRDRARMEALYTPIVKTWFPRGLDDPHLALIRFDAERGQFWDSPGGALQVLAAFTKSLLTGQPGKAGETGRVQLQ